ncbi:MAG: hypothetical protein H7Z17_15625, partial [Fuerstia sp.]|nr:hypothetical protein [Fuerstiella sp.]
MITLTHVDGTRLYQGENSAELGFLTYYVSDAQMPTAQLPAILTIDQAWSDAALLGYFLILKTQPTDIRVFAEVVAAFGFGAPKHASFVWVQYESSPPKITATYQLDLEPGEIGEHVVIATGAIFRFGNYGLPFMPRGLVQPVSTEGGGIHQFRFEYPLNYPSDRPDDVPPEIPRPSGTGVNVPLLGPQRYTLQSLALVGDFSNNSSQGLDIGLRYFYEQGGRVASQYYPIFAPPANGYQVEFQINWDPLALLDPKRSWMKFTGNAYIVTITGEGQGRIEVAANGNVLPSWLRTIYGKALWLRPVLEGEHAARLVMQPRPGDNPNEPAYYMVPDGDYELLAEPTAALADAPAQLNLLCGLAGTESIGFSPGTCAAPLTMIRFHPWKPAFAPVFPLTDASGGTAASGAFRSQALASSPLLDDTWPTAWLSVAPSGAVANTEAVYYAQPEQAALYDAGQDAPAANILQLFQAPVAVFDSDSLDHSYPVAIYAGLADGKVSGGFPAGDVRRFEMQILNHFRKETMSGILAAQRVLVAAKDKAGRRRSQAPPPLVTTT